MNLTLILGIIGFVLLVVVPGLWLNQIRKPTRGPRIGKIKKPQKALLVIDLQEDTTGPETKVSPPYRRAGEVIGEVNRLIETARERNFLVLYIRQEFTGFPGILFSRLFARGGTIAGNSGCALDRRITVVSRYDFTKPIGDAFANPRLAEFLTHQEVDELWLVGADAEFCVHLTALGALNRGYKVNVIREGLLLRAEKKWEKILAAYRRDGIGVWSSEQFTAPLPDRSAPPGRK